MVDVVIAKNLDYASDVIQLEALEVTFSLTLPGPTLT